MKVVINRCFGGFGLSHEAIMRYAEIKGIKLRPPDKTHDYYSIESVKPLKGAVFCAYDIGRADPALVQVVTEMGEAANGECSKLKIIEIPNDIAWHITDYDGMESVAEEHSAWF